MKLITKPSSVTYGFELSVEEFMTWEKENDFRIDNDMDTLYEEMDETFSTFIEADWDGMLGAYISVTVSDDSELGLIYNFINKYCH